VTTSSQRIALQLYSVRALARQDLLAVLEEVARIGYAGVEFAGLFGNEPAEVRGVLDRLGLTAIGAHVGLDDLEDRLDETVVDLLGLGCGAAIVAWLPPERYADAVTAEQTVERLVAAGERVRAAGLGFAYHNHDFEFRPIDGTTLWSLLIRPAPDHLPLEIDVHWVRHAGLDPARVIRDLGPRVTLIHAKDTASDGTGDSPVGQGIEDWPDVIDATRHGGVEWLVVEQEQSSDILADIETSLKNLRRLLA
jgi:sugar phosphate isomerase/epimerase